MWYAFLISFFFPPDVSLPSFIVCFSGKQSVLNHLFSLFLQILICIIILEKLFMPVMQNTDCPYGYDFLYASLIIILCYQQLEWKIVVWVVLTTNNFGPKFLISLGTFGVSYMLQKIFIPVRSNFSNEIVQTFLCIKNTLHNFQTHFTCFL